jgi:hypothetical protein
MKIGTKVKIKFHQVENLNSDTIYTVDDYNDDLCGEGCCEGCHLAEYPDKQVWFWPSDLEIVEEKC